MKVASRGRSSDVKTGVALFAIGGLIVMNLLTFATAYPEIFTIDTGCCAKQLLAKDFSAFYVGAWRLFHDPSRVYTQGNVNDGGPQIDPEPEAYKYLPSFLLIIFPLTWLDYQQALVAFDVIQLFMLPLMAFIAYRLVRSKGLAATIFVAAMVLLQPSPINNWGLSVSYYWQWAEGQAKVLDTFFLLLSFYLGKSGRPTLSGTSFAIAAFDPRFALLAMPLFMLYNRWKLRVSFVTAAAIAASTNLMLLIPGVGTGFVEMVLRSGLTTPLFYYGWIPVLTILSLMLVNAPEILDSLGHATGNILGEGKKGVGEAPVSTRPDSRRHP